MTNDTALLVLAAVGLWYFYGPSSQPPPAQPRPVDHVSQETRDPVPESTVFALSGDSSDLRDIQNSQINYVI
ncbi:hypothetical protein DAPPUDRAFT_277250 [Daphnia pulex]|uniref:Uncharacterized protein n=1 Tax=Daphnia pulex TaxID=6669 RepID=E9I696_DAPPU|nr:hypothetical protein DAPPUDRAFT_277250 [Daphnia pulex]|eukprot:EFX60483.1 hypothetical protein DAPPUDRAFT_277250 [Daphnia pulex]